MAELLQCETYGRKLFIVLCGHRATYEGENFEDARAAYHALTGDWVPEPTADAAALFAVLERVISGR